MTAVWPARPKRRSANKQRITKMTARERAAAFSGGCKNETIPEEALRILLRQKIGPSSDEAAILREIANEVGTYRLFHEANQKCLSLSEVKNQAAQTCAVIEELQTRLKYLHPLLRVHSDEVYITRLEKKPPWEFDHSMDSDLTNLFAVLTFVRGRLPKEGRKGRRKDQSRIAAARSVYAALMQHSTPKIAPSDARALAIDLLRKCEIDMPEDRREIERLLPLPKK